MNSTGVGDVSELQFIARAIELGYECFPAYSAASRVDVILLKNSVMYRVQIKTACLKDGFLSIRSSSKFKKPGSRKRTADRSYKGEIDALGIYSPDTKSCYFVFLEKVKLGTQISLRLQEKGKVRKNSNYARNFVF